MRPAMRLLLAATLALLAAVAVPCQGKNVLMYGNSFSFFNSGVGLGLRRVAEAAGHPTPNVYERFAAGQTLTYHATDPGQVAAINNSLPPGQQWDVVVMQGHSLEATATLGNPTQFRSRAVGIASSVRNHSPSARAVLYQTWSRARGHFFYPTTYPDPMAMHAEIRGSYRLAADDIDAAHGAGSARLARVGDGLALLEFDHNVYAPDLYHPGPAMTLLASMCLFTSIYDERACDIQANLASGSALANYLAAIGLGAADWHAMAAIADRCADPSLRPFPGSGDQLLLESGSPPGATNACGYVEIGVGSNLVLQLSTPNDVYNGVPSWLVATVFANGAPPTASPTLPELHVDPGNLLILQTAPSASITIFASLPLSLPGLSVLVQGVAFAPSSETGNAQLATTDGHVLKFY